MSLVRRGVEAVGADYHQWRVLTRAMLKVDMRSTSPLQVGDRPQRDGVGLTFFFVHGFTGVAAAVVVAFVPDLFGGTMIAMSIIMVLLATALLTDYQTVVSSPADFEVLGYQPISSRTYFLSRLTNLMFYAGLIGVLTGGPSLLVVFVKYGGLALAGWLIALATAVFWVVLIVTTGYAAMLHVVPPDRLKRGLGYLQLLTSTAVYGSFFLLPLLIGGRIAVSFVVEASPWLLLYPPVWFACLPRIATGSLDILDGFSLLIVVGSIAVMAGMARGRLSLAYTERLGALLSSGTRPRRKTGMARRRRIPRWRARLPPELAIMATLIRAQFRHDMRFRMVVLSAFPLALCMLAVPFLRQLESAADEIGLDATMAMGLVHLSTILLPLTLLDNLRYSESFRASWIFFSTPSDPARLTVQAVNCTAILFLFPYLAMVAAALSWIFEDVLRGVSHAFLLGLSTVATLQLALLCTPLVPFSEPPPKGRQSGRHVVFAIVASLVGYAALPPLITFATLGTTVFAVVSLVMIACCVLLQRVLAGRIRQRVERIEFVG
ncbi:MAG: hypothetical protein OXL38_04195 [Gammaproteobacteria bacterium]|nr:hypothetical protein [Gammaproteobacteria bacterium]